VTTGERKRVPLKEGKWGALTEKRERGALT